jgi:hypothetical protein
LSVRGVVVFNGDPPDAPAYHLIAVPVADRLVTVGLAEEQNVCGLSADGASGVV